MRITRTAHFDLIEEKVTNHLLNFIQSDSLVNGFDCCVICALKITGQFLPCLPSSNTLNSITNKRKPAAA